MDRSVVLACVVAMAGCGAENEQPDLGDAPVYPVAGCEAIDHRPCDVLEPECQARLQALAACLRGGEAGEPVPVSVMSRAELMAYYESAIAESQPRPEPDHYERALVLLGLVAEGAFDDETVVDEATEFIAGFYDHVDDHIVLIDDEDALDRNWASSLLLHEYVHALQDRDVDFEAYGDERYTSYDAYLGAAALVEGEADLHQARYGAAMLGLDPQAIDWPAHFAGSIELADADLLEQESLYTASRRRFPYAYGSRYLYFAFETGGYPAVLERFASPPNTHTLMVSAAGIVEPSFVPTQLAAPAPAAEWTLLADDVLGAWGTFLCLLPGSNEAKARRLAIAWRGDRLAVYERANTHTAVALRLHFSDASTATEAAAVLAYAFGPETTRTQGSYVLVARSSDRSPLEWAFTPP